MRGGGGG
ncbi:hypothetical protein CP03DC35_0264A, partial [Chlamydia psittaci 03DC35]